MKHEYLIQATKSPTYMNSRTLEHPYLIICAVLELHKPQEITLPDGSYGVNCEHCDGWVYPCKTMILIADGIGVCLSD
jgi:hypothetical protein